MATRIKVFTRESENHSKSNNGGDYYFGYFLIWNKEREVFIKKYFTSAEFDYCSIYGTFERCSQCAEWNGSCSAKPEEVTLEAYYQLLNRLESVGVNLYKEV